MALLNPDAPPQAPVQSPTQSPLQTGGSFKNPLLAQLEAKLESQLTPYNKPDYLKIVVAGMKLVNQGGPDGMITRLTNSKTPLQSAVNGSINLVIHMARGSKGQMPPKAMVPAAMTLMFHALDVLDRTGKLQVTNEIVVQAAKMFTDSILTAFNINNAKLNQMAQQTHGMTQNQAAMQRLQQHASKFRAPPLPGAGAAPILRR